MKKEKDVFYSVTVGNVTIEAREIPQSRQIESIGSAYYYTFGVRVDITHRDPRFEGTHFTTYSETFLFKDNTNNYEQGIEQLDESSLADALLSLLLDAKAGQLSFVEFAQEYGYIDIQTASTAYTICKQATDKIGLTLGNILIEEFAEAIEEGNYNNL